jgi:hypothetical protein
LANTPERGCPTGNASERSNALDKFRSPPGNRTRGRGGYGWDSRAPKRQPAVSKLILKTRSSVHGIPRMMLAACVINWNNGLGSQTLNTVSTAINRAIAATQLKGVDGPPACLSAVPNSR